MAQNPVINKFGSAAGGQPGGAASAATLQTMYDQPAYAPPRAIARYMTLDDVVIRTGAMLGVLLVAGGISWSMVDQTSSLPLLLIGAMGGLAIGLYISFTMKANAVTSLTYAAFEGLFLGAISHLFDARYPGVVVQAITGTIMVAAGMLFVYKIGAIRVTPKFTRIVVGATFGVFGLMLVNLIASFFHPGGLGLRSGGSPVIAIGFSLLCIGIAAMNLVMDFDVIERGIRNGVDERYAWYASFGLMVTLVWLYIEMLRLLSMLRGR